MYKENQIEERFKKFHERYNYLEIQECIEFYSIFDGHPFFKFIPLDFDLATCIQQHIIDRIDDLKPYFIYDDNPEFQKSLEAVLNRLSIGDRKSYTVYKKENISQMRGRMLFKALFEKGVIKKEKSREKPLRDFKGQLIKKHLRRYEIQDKIHFCDNFTRFWFTFIKPYLEDKIRQEHLLEYIMSHIDKYISLCFEELSIELLIKKIGLDNITSFGSYWDKNIEIDLLIETKDGTIIAGESKWKNHRINKKILNALEKKVQRVDFNVDKLALFSKSGFSKELSVQNNKAIELYDIKDFKELYNL